MYNQTAWIVPLISSVVVLCSSFLFKATSNFAPESKSPSSTTDAQYTTNNQVYRILIKGMSSVGVQRLFNNKFK